MADSPEHAQLRSPAWVRPARPEEFLALHALDRLAWGASDFIVDGEHTWRIWCEYATVLVAGLQPQGPSLAALLCLPGKDQVDVLHKIFVHPDHRGDGLGSALMQALLGQARRPMILTVDPANTRALGVYERMGFVKEQLVPGYYRPDEDRFVMRWDPKACPSGCNP